MDRKVFAYTEAGLTPGAIRFDDLSGKLTLTAVGEGYNSQPVSVVLPDEKVLELAHELLRYEIAKGVRS